MTRGGTLARALLAALLALAVGGAGPAEAAKSAKTSSSKKKGTTSRKKKPAPPAPLPKLPDVPPLVLESAGPAGAVRGVVVPGGRLAGAVVWPPVDALETGDVSAGSSLVAAQLAAAAASSSEPGATPLVALLPEGIAVGVRLESGDEARLARLLAAIASPRAAPEAERRAALEGLQRAASEHWSSPDVVARRAALGLLQPGRRAAWDPLPGPQAFAEIDAGSRAAVFAAVREAPVRYLVAGPAGLALRLAPALVRPGAPATGPVGAGALQAAPVPATRLPVAALIEEEDASGAPGRVGLALGFVLGDAVGSEAQRVALAVLAEALSEGEGSLAQRLKVVLGQSAPASVEIVRSAGAPGGTGRDEALVMTALVPAPSAALAWRVLTGAVNSVRTIALREDALYRARKRLADKALARRSDPGAALLEAFGGGTPVSTATLGPVRGSDVLAVAQQALAPASQASVAAGALGEQFAEVTEFAQALRLALERFDPLSATLMQSGGASERDAAAAQELARAALVALAEGRTPAFDPRYKATYRVREETPTGAVDCTLRVAASPDGISWSLDAPDWTLEAEERAGSGSPPAEGVIHLPQPNRLLGLALREPAILLASVLDGSVDAEAMRATCDGALCPALRVELDDGSVLTLVLDESTRMPRALRTWWPGKDESRPPDEQVRYLAWRRAGSVQVAEQMTLEDALGTTRRIALVDWSWP